MIYLFYGEIKARRRKKLWQKVGGQMLLCLDLIFR